MSQGLFGLPTMLQLVVCRETDWLCVCVCVWCVLHQAYWHHEGARVLIAGFHNSSLYEALRASIGPLVSLLHDGEDKTRANAAGALGNLVRNSGLLCCPLIKAHALQVCVPCAPAMNKLHWWCMP